MTSARSVAVAACLAAAAVWCCSPPSDGDGADLLFRGGTILTLAAGSPDAEALAVRDGRIVAVGPLAAVAEWQSARTQVVDLAGRALLPGFVEPHTHPAASAVLYGWVDVSGFGNDSAEQAWARLREAGRRARPGEWILAFGWDPILLRGAEAPRADVLDREVSSTNPVWVMLQAMHSHYVNHEALARAGITSETPDPPGGGYYERDAAGNPTGFVTETVPMLPIVAQLPEPSRAESRERLGRMLDRYNEAGVTTIGVPGLIDFVMPEAEDLLREFARGDDARVRVKLYRAGNAMSEGITGSPGPEDDAYQVLGVKYWLDGSPYSGSMLLEEPYLESDLMQRGLGIPRGSRGRSMYPPGALVERLRGAHRGGWQLSIHSQGDAATALAMDAYAAVLHEHPRSDHRHRVEHLVMTTQEGLRRAAELGVTPSFHMLHLYYYGRALRDEILGPERGERMLPVAWAKQHGHRFSFHSDSPMYPPDPLLTVETAVTRRTREGDVIGPELAVPVEDALAAITRDAAWQMFMEDEIGSLEAGKRADLVILSADPRRVDPGRIAEIEVVATYLGGRRLGRPAARREPGGGEGHR